MEMTDIHFTPVIPVTEPIADTATIKTMPMENPKTGWPGIKFDITFPQFQKSKIAKIAMLIATQKEKIKNPFSPNTVFHIIAVSHRLFQPISPDTIASADKITKPIRIAARPLKKVLPSPIVPPIEHIFTESINDIMTIAIS